MSADCPMEGMGDMPRPQHPHTPDSLDPCGYCAFFIHSPALTGFAVIHVLPVDAPHLAMVFTPSSTRAVHTLPWRSRGPPLIG